MTLRLLIHIELTLRLLTQHQVEFVVVAQRAAGRPKDLLVLPELEALREIAEENE